MPKPAITVDQKTEVSEELQMLGRSVFNLFPHWDIRLFGELDSTNAEARRITLTLGGDAWARLILTDFQSQGRGRMERVWEAPPCSSLMATIMAPRKIFITPTSLLPLAVGCWLAEGLERNGVKDIAIKWPNDVLVTGQKIGGILCETSAAAILIGVGINLDQNREDLPERAPTEPQATSLKLVSGANYPGRLVASLTLMSALLESIENPPSAQWVLKTFRKMCCSFGTTVTFKDPLLGLTRGVAEEVDETGALIVNVEGHGRRLVTNMLDGA